MSGIDIFAEPLLPWIHVGQSRTLRGALAELSENHSEIGGAGCRRTWPHRNERSLGSNMNLRLAVVSRVRIEVSLSWVIALAARPTIYGLV